MKSVVLGLFLMLFVRVGTSGEPSLSSISPTQELELQLIRAAGQWNSFEGPSIDEALRGNKALWRAAMLSREHKPLIQLRDLSQGFVNADNLYILVEPGKTKELENLARKWGASEMSWLNIEQASEAMGTGVLSKSAWTSDSKRVILQLWWH